MGFLDDIAKKRKEDELNRKAIEEKAMAKVAVTAPKAESKKDNRTKLKESPKAKPETKTEVEVLPDNFMKIPSEEPAATVSEEVPATKKKEESKAPKTNTFVKIGELPEKSSHEDEVKVKFSTRIPAVIKKALEEEAEEQGRSYQYTVSLLLEFALDLYPLQELGKKLEYGKGQEIISYSFTIPKSFRERMVAMGTEKGRPSSFVFIRLLEYALKGIGRLK